MRKYWLTFILIFWVINLAWAKSKIHPATLFMILGGLSSAFIVALWVAIWLRRKRK